MEYEAEPTIRERVQAVRNHEGPVDALRAARSIDRRLAHDNASGVLVDPTAAKIIAFPGCKRFAQPEYGPFNQPGAIHGVPIRLGGEGDPVPAYLPSIVSNGCEAARNSSKLHEVDDPLHEIHRSRLGMAAFDAQTPGSQSQGSKWLLEAAIATWDAKRRGGKKSGSGSTWAKVKFDRQIVAIAKVRAAGTICSNDEDIRKFAARENLKVVPVWELPEPPLRQTQMFEEPER